MKITIDFKNEKLGAFGKMPLTELREQLNVPQRLIAKRSGKVIQDIASIEGHDDITFSEPEMITISVSLEITIPEGSTVEQLTNLISESLTHKKLQVLSSGKNLHTNHRLGNENGITFVLDAKT